MKTASFKAMNRLYFLFALSNFLSATFSNHPMLSLLHITSPRGLHPTATTTAQTKLTACE